MTKLRVGRRGTKFAQHQPQPALNDFEPISKRAQRSLETTTKSAAPTG